MTNKVTYLDDSEFCIIKKDNVEFFDEKGNKVNKKVLELSKMKKIMLRVIINILWLKK